MTRRTTSDQVDTSAAVDEAPVTITDTGQEIATYNKMTFEDLAAIASFEDALRIAGEDGSLIGAEALGDGFRIETDKEKLVGVTFVVVDWDYGKNVTMGEKFIIIRLVTQDGRKLIITDGSTGIMRQLEMLFQVSKGKLRRVLCNGGLRASQYWIAEEMGVGIVQADYAGKKKLATTYYIDAV